MRYLLLIQTNPDAVGPTGPDERLAEEMGKLLEDMTKAGVLLDTAGLRPIEEATRIRLACLSEAVQALNLCLARESQFVRSSLQLPPVDLDEELRAFDAAT